MNTLVEVRNSDFLRSGLAHNEMLFRSQDRQKCALEGAVRSGVAAMGITNEKLSISCATLSALELLSGSSVLNLANDPAVERLITPRLALTAAEYLAYDTICTFWYSYGYHKLL